MSETVTSNNAESFGSFGQFRKTAISRISEFTMPPGTTYQTPEGLRAEDEDTRIAFDSQGGVYPIRESVFRETYRAALSGSTAPLDVEARCALCGRKYTMGQTHDCPVLVRQPNAAVIRDALLDIKGPHQEYVDDLSESLAAALSGSTAPLDRDRLAVALVAVFPDMRSDVARMRADLIAAQYGGTQPVPDAETFAAAMSIAYKSVGSWNDFDDTVLAFAEATIREYVRLRVREGLRPSPDPAQPEDQHPDDPPEHPDDKRMREEVRDWIERR